MIVMAFYEIYVLVFTANDNRWSMGCAMQRMGITVQALVGKEPCSKAMAEALATDSETEHW